MIIITRSYLSLTHGNFFIFFYDFRGTKFVGEKETMATIRKNDKKRVRMTSRIGNFFFYLAILFFASEIIHRSEAATFHGATTDDDEEKIVHEEQQQQRRRRYRRNKKGERIDRRVKSVLKAVKNNNLYGIMGIRNWNVRIPSWDINLWGLFSCTVPGFTIKEISEKDLKRQFRKRALQVHPDKNKDARAKEAFVAVENAATILLDKQRRKEYDEMIKQHRSEQFQIYHTLMKTCIQSAWTMIRNFAMIVKTFLGPFFVPVLIIGIIII